MEEDKKYLSKELKKELEDIFDQLRNGKWIVRNQMSRAKGGMFDDFIGDWLVSNVMDHSKVYTIIEHDYYRVTQLLEDLGVISEEG